MGEPMIHALNEAIAKFEEAAASATDNIKYSECLNNIGVALQRRYEQGGLVEDLDRAIRVLYQAIKEMPDDHPYYSAILNNLGSALDLHFELTGLMEDLDESINIMEEAVQLTPKHHQD